MSPLPGTSVSCPMTFTGRTTVYAMPATQTTWSSVHELSGPFDVKNLPSSEFYPTSKSTGMIRPCFEHWRKVRSLSKCLRPLGGRPRPSAGAPHSPRHPDTRRVYHPPRSCAQPAFAVPPGKRGGQKGRGERFPLLNLSTLRLALGTRRPHGQVPRKSKTSHLRSVLPAVPGGRGYLMCPWAPGSRTAAGVGAPPRGPCAPERPGRRPPCATDGGKDVL